MYKDQGVGTVVNNVVRLLHYRVRRWGRLKSKKKSIIIIKKKSISIVACKVVTRQKNYKARTNWL